jgi:uncharacterized membrane protein YkvA (DUF1232 family)
LKTIDKGGQGIGKILEECLALLFLLKDRRVHWHAKLVVLLLLAYIASPIDLIPDGPMLFGQIDDLIIVRFSYAPVKEIWPSDHVLDLPGLLATATSAPCCPASPESCRPCTSGRTRQHSTAHQG